jgi:2',3'-cyclic-nucleotide 2'-phosphodiesterase (5'-nucleotidase family)
MMKVVVILLIGLTITLAEKAFQTVAIIGTNDIHGSAFPTELYRTDTQQTYNYGGL